MCKNKIRIVRDLLEIDKILMKNEDLRSKIAKAKIKTILKLITSA